MALAVGAVFVSWKWKGDLYHDEETVRGNTFVAKVLYLVTTVEF